MRYHLRPEDMTEDEIAVRFRWFTREQLAESIAVWGLPDRCTDPDVLASAAAIQLAAEAEAARREDDREAT